ncbi:MAG: type II toxin-antitoxin system VapC family toxin [Desulfatiglans sp.]|nr:type II toxin-antitoxin system VapC family toxin [Desulfatiglans sp.]
MSLIKPSVLRKAVYGKQILVDTNIIIYLTDLVEPYVSLSRLLFEMIEKGETSAVISVISIAEVMHGPLKKGNLKNAFDVKNYLMNFPNILCQEITEKVITNIGIDEKIEWANLRVMDSLIIASGVSNNVDLIISNDTHFKKALSKNYILTFDE